MTTLSINGRDMMKGVIFIGVIYVTFITTLASGGQTSPFYRCSLGEGQKSTMAHENGGSNGDSQRVFGYKGSPETASTDSTASKEEISTSEVANFQPNCLIFWTAKWCKACRKMKPIIASLRVEGYTVYTFNYDRNPELAKKMNVKKLPTMIIHEDAKEIKRFTGVTSAREIKEYLKRNKKRDES